jgi:hypothetical protein
MKASTSRQTTEADAMKRILAEPGPDILVPVLQKTKYVLVVEDFHYLGDDEKKILFQQWKRFVDSEVTVIILGTTHRAVDIANSNRDLLGSISQIDMGHWAESDLEQICQKGFDHLGVEISALCKKKIATEAVGLPIIVQQICLNLFSSEGIVETRQIKPGFRPSIKDVDASLHQVANQKYTQFESYYNTLFRGPREKSRKYRTYELVIACFTLDPIQFSLSRAEIDIRISKMSKEDIKAPPAASLNSTLGALAAFQQKRGFTLLEWQPSEQILYIVEPAFLFYVRWRVQKSTPNKQLDLFEILISKIHVSLGSLIKPNELLRIKAIKPEI